MKMSMSTYSIEITGTVTSSWLPLTTAYAVPEVCTGIFRDVGKPGLHGGTLLGYDPNTASLAISIPITGADSACNPVQQTNWWTGTVSTTGSQKIGIGPLVCPLS